MSWQGESCPGGGIDVLTGERCPGRGSDVLAGGALSWQGERCPGRGSHVRVGGALTHPHWIHDIHLTFTCSPQM